MYKLTFGPVFVNLFKKCCAEIGKHDIARYPTCSAHQKKGQKIVLKQHESGWYSCFAKQYGTGKVYAKNLKKRRHSRSVQRKKMVRNIRASS